MAFARLPWRRRPTPAEAPPPPPEPARTVLPHPAEPDALESILKQIEEDVVLAMRVVGHTAEDVRAEVDRTVAIMHGIREAGVELTGLSATAFDVATGLADTTRHLEQTGEAIEGHIVGTDEFIADAQSLAGTVTADMHKLGEAVDRIAGIVAIIGAIARKTNLLALNASIEAARAGAAGRGFAVVATEVKALAQQVQTATADISSQIVRLQGVARSSGATVADIARLLERVGPVMNSVRDAVRTQIAGARDVASRAGESLQFVSVVSQKTDAMTRMTAEATEAARLVGETAGRMPPAMQRLSDRSAAFLAHAKGRSRRQSPRLPMRRAARFSPRPGSNRPAADLRTLDLSVGGGLTEPPLVQLQVGDAGALAIEGIGEVEAIVRSVKHDGVQFEFRSVPDDVATVIQGLVAQSEQENRPHIALAQALAIELGDVFTRAVASGLVSADDLITIDYRRVPGTEPIQYETAALPFYRDVLPALLDRYRLQCPQRVFVVACDRNGYVPVHEAETSQPQRPGEIAWNDRCSRDRRIFDNPHVLLVARNQAPFTLSAMMRWMPDGRWEGRS